MPLARRSTTRLAFALGARVRSGKQLLRQSGFDGVRVHRTPEPALAEPRSAVLACDEFERAKERLKALKTWRNTMFRIHTIMYQAHNTFSLYI